MWSQQLNYCEGFSLGMKSKQKHTHTRWNRHIPLVLDLRRVHFYFIQWTRSPLENDSVRVWSNTPLTLRWLFNDQNGFWNSIFCFSNRVAGWRCSSSVTTPYKSYLFGMGWVNISYQAMIALTCRLHTISNPPATDYLGALAQSLLRSPRQK